MQVAPAELEAILIGHPEIIDAAVIPCVSIYLQLTPSPSPKHKHTHTDEVQRRKC